MNRAVRVEMNGFRGVRFRVGGLRIRPQRLRVKRALGFKG